MDPVREKEKELMQDALNHPGTKILMQKLQGAADALGNKYDTAVEYRDFMKIQQLRAVLKVELPRIIENIVNRDEDEKWSFREWLKKKLP